MKYFETLARFCLEYLIEKFDSQNLFSSMLNQISAYSKNVDTSVIQNSYFGILNRRSSALI